MEPRKHIIAVATRYDLVVQHVFSDLYTAIRFLKKGEREGKHLALGAFDPASGVVYALDTGKEGVPSQVRLDDQLKNFIELGFKAARVELY